MGECEEVQRLFALSARYNGPDSSRVAASEDVDEEKIHDAILSKEYTYNKPSTRKGDHTRLKRWQEYCTKKGFPDCHPYPALRVYTNLKVELERNDDKGNRGIDNVQDTLNSLRKLARIQGCPAFTDKDSSLMISVTKQAQQAAYAQATQAPRDHSKSAQNRQTLTSVEIDNVLAVCAQSLRLEGARAQVLVQLELQTGFRGCEVIHARWYHMQIQEADQLCRIGPDAFRAIGIGINQGETNRTGAMRWTGFAQHAYAHCDLAASLGELLSCEIYENDLGLIDMILDRDQGWDEFPILFPEHTHNTPEQKVGQATRLLDSMTKQIPGWSKDKRMHLFWKYVAQQLRVHGAGHSNINKYLGWADDVQSKYYTLADLQAGDRPHAIIAGFTKSNWHQQHHLGRSTVPLPSTGWLDALIPRLTEALQEKDALPVRSQEMLECLRIYTKAYWQALPVKGLKHTEAYLDRQVPGVQKVLQTPMYRQFAEQVIRKEADSLQKLGLKAPHLAL